MYKILLTKTGSIIMPTSFARGPCIVPRRSFNSRVHQEREKQEQEQEQEKTVYNQTLVPDDPKPENQ